MQYFENLLHFVINLIPAVCWGLIPIPSSVIIADVAGVTLNSSAANLSTAVNGVLSGTLSLQLQVCHFRNYLNTFSRIIKYMIHKDLRGEFIQT